MFKKVGLFVGLLFLSTICKADWFNRDEYFVNYSTQIAAAVNYATSTVLIDLSDEVNWPHKGTRSIQLNRIRVNVDKVAAATLAVRIGVITDINATVSSVTWVAEGSWERNVSNTALPFDVNFFEGFLDTRVNPSATGGVTPNILSYGKLLSTTTFQNDVRLFSPKATNVLPAVGDIVMTVWKDVTNAVNINVFIEYSAENQ